MTFTKTVTLPVSPEDAFALVTQPERLRRWLAVSAQIDLRAGGEFRWTVSPGHHAAGTVREIDPGKRVVLGFGWEDGDDLVPDSSTVTITVEPVGDGTAVTLTHDGLNEEQAASHAEGWSHFLERLSTLATTGDAGPDEWAYAPANLTPLVAAEATLAVMQPILRNMTEEDMTMQTPCADYDGHALAEHLFGTLTSLGQYSGVDVVRPDGTLESQVSDVAAQVITGFENYDAPEVVGGGVPTEVAQTIVSVELLIHGWDFAQASGQDVHVSDEVVAWVAEHSAPIMDSVRSKGAFADKLSAADDATPLERLLAYSGRKVA